MANKNSSFMYGIDNLYTIPENNVLRKYDYYNGLVGAYQDERKAIIDKKQNWEELQLAKERYSKKPTYTSQEKPFNKESLLVAVRENGYLAYIDKLPAYNPFVELATVSVESVGEYMNNYFYNQDPGFFYFSGKLTTIVVLNTNGVFIIIDSKLVNPLCFCESYVYDSEAKTIVFSSNFYDSITVEAYTKDQFVASEPGGKNFFYVTNSSFDKIPTGKYPGYPLYKRIIVDGVTNDFDTVTIGNDTIQIKNNIGKVIELPYDEAQNGKCKVYIEGTGSQNLLHLAFTPSMETVIKDYYPVDITFKKGSTVYKDTVKMSTKINYFNPLTNLLTIKSPDIYLEVPTIYQISFNKSAYITETQAKNIKVAYMYFNDSVIEMDLTYNGTTNNGNTFNYTSDPVKLPLVKDLPKDIRIEMRLFADDVKSIYPPLNLQGYTTSAINSVPTDYLRVTQKLVTSPLTYTEGGKNMYRFTFQGVGTLEITGVTLYRVSDSLEYFRTNDFQTKLISRVDDLYTYDLVLDNKVFLDPVKETVDKMRFVFLFECIRIKDKTKHDWIGEPIKADMTLTYVQDRWVLSDARIDNPLIGDAVLSFKIYDKLLKKFTDKYDADQRLQLNDGFITLLTDNVTSVDGIMNWDFVAKEWNYSVRTKRYGTIEFKYSNAVATSNEISVAHSQPPSPIKTTVQQATQYVLSKGRVIINLSYSDDIKDIYINGTSIGIDTPFESSICYGGKYWITTILNPMTKKVTALGLDLIPPNEDPMEFDLQITQINDRVYTDWNLNVKVEVTVKPQIETINPTFTIKDFKYGVECVGTLKLGKTILADGQVVAETFDATSGKVIDYPSFDPVGKGDFLSKNIMIGSELSEQKDYILSFKVYEEANAKKDDKLPSTLFYFINLPFKVS